MGLAVEQLCSVNAIDTLLSNFLEPLQGPAIATQKDGVLDRIHCSLNINTETGRLSARRPNLQNQPAGDKDSYKVPCLGACDLVNLVKRATRRLQRRCCSTDIATESIWS